MTAKTMNISPSQMHLAFFRPSDSPRWTAMRAWITSLVLRMAMFRGFVVVLVGPPRSGKTYLLDRTTPQRVIDVSEGLRDGDPVFNFGDIPSHGVFSLEEVQAFGSNVGNIIASVRDRNFAVSLQDKTLVPPILSALGRRRIFLVEFDSGHANK